MLTCLQLRPIVSSTKRPPKAYSQARSQIGHPSIRDIVKGQDRVRIRGVTTHSDNYEVIGLIRNTQRVVGDRGKRKARG